jgi:hypothetical protein
MSALSSALVRLSAVLLQLYIEATVIQNIFYPS